MDRAHFQVYTFNSLHQIDALVYLRIRKIFRMVAPWCVQTCGATSDVPGCPEVNDMICVCFQYLPLSTVCRYNSWSRMHGTSVCGGVTPESVFCITKLNVYVIWNIPEDGS